MTKLSAAKEHVECDAHKHAMKCHRKSVNPNHVEDRERGQASLASSFLHGDELLVEVSYFVAKEEMAFLKYPAILKLEEIHGVDVGMAYRTDKNCAEFIDYIGQDLHLNVSEKIKRSNFYSVLFDGSTDNSAKEQEGFYILLFNPKLDDKPDTLEVKMKYFGIKNTKASNGGATATGIKHGNEECFKDAKDATLRKG